ncbi:MAG TPA: itaconate degradation C-C-lyase RipC [Blastocatellia bacterium]
MPQIATENSIFLLKSWLFTPATMADRFGRAAEAGADALIIDLEDAIAPRFKDQARTSAVDFLSGLRENHLPCAVRINPPNGKTGLDDLEAILESRADPDFLVLPKSDSSGVLALVDALLREAGKSTRIIALIETARGLAHLEEIALGTPKPAAFLFGVADLAADLGSEIDWEPMLFARSRLIHASALAGIAALDSPWFDISDRNGLKQETQAAARLGFHGKAAIHPGQIGIINDSFTPTPEQIEQAKQVLEVSAKGAGLVERKMVDEAVARRARLILARAGKIDS